jgi:hypothetical protein
VDKSSFYVEFDLSKVVSQADLESAPKIEFLIYYGLDGTLVVELSTSNMEEDKNGPVIRVYLNDGPIYENPPYSSSVNSHTVEEKT